MGTNAASSAELFITKLGAAERQLNAAIRMVLADEDELAIHTVAAAAYRQLRDIEVSRGRSPYANWYARFLIGAADLAASGRALPLEAAFGPTIVEIVEDIAREIAEGRPPTVFDVSRRIRHPNEGVFWQSANSTANFLKHADRDIGDGLPVNNIEEQNRKLLTSALGSFADLVGRLTPEMEAFLIYYGSAYEGFSWCNWWPEELTAQFQEGSPARRRQICRRALAAAKKRARRMG